MVKLTEKKRKWIIQQYKSGRRVTSIAKVQKISRQYVYDLVAKYKKEGINAYKAKKPGRPKIKINKNFIHLVKDIRQDTDYGSEKIHIVLKERGSGVSQHIIQRVLDEQKLTEPCLKRRGKRKYVRYQWPISNYMWHTDWSELNGEWYIAYIDDRSRRIMASGIFDSATTENALFVLHQAILMNGVSPKILLSDKGTQFYNSKKNKKGERPPGVFEQQVKALGIEFWTSKRNHPQTNGKMEKWFDTMKKRFKKHPKETLKEFVQWYNEIRIHHALNFKTPERIYWENL